MFGDMLIEVKSYVNLSIDRRFMLLTGQLT